MEGGCRWRRGRREHDSDSDESQRREAEAFQALRVKLEYAEVFGSDGVLVKLAGRSHRSYRRKALTFLRSSLALRKQDERQYGADEGHRHMMDAIAACVHHIEAMDQTAEGGTAKRKRGSVGSSFRLQSEVVVCEQEFRVLDYSNSERIILPAQCQVTFPSAHVIQDLTAQDVTQDGVLAVTDSVSNGKPRSFWEPADGLVPAGPLTQFLPAGTKFKPPAVLRFTVDLDLQRQMNALGVATEVCIFKWMEDTECWERLPGCRLVPNSEAEYEVESDSFSFLRVCLVPFRALAGWSLQSGAASHSHEVSFFGRVDREHIEKSSKFAFTVQICPVASHEPSGSVRLVSHSHVDPVPIQPPTELQVQLQFPDPSNLKWHRVGSDVETVRIKETLRGSATFYLQWNGIGDMFVIADIFETNGVDRGGRLARVHFTIQGRVFAPQRDESLVKPQISVFLARKRSDGTVDTEREGQMLKNILDRHFTVSPAPRPTFREFEEEMWRAPQRNTCIVHFAGHCVPAGFQFLQDQQGHVLVTESNQVLATAVGKASASDGGPKVCVLNACHSEDLGRAMVAEGLCRVVCWRGVVRDDDALAFADSFYRYLAHCCDSRRPGDDIDDVKVADEAYERGKLAVAAERHRRLHGSSEHTENSGRAKTQGVSFVHKDASKAEVLLIGETRAASPDRASTSGGSPPAGVKPGWAQRGLDEAECWDAVEARCDDEEAHVRYPTNVQGECERKAFEELGIKVEYNCCKVDETIRKYWSGTVRGDQLHRWGLEETSCRHGARPGKLHLRYTTAALRSFVLHAMDRASGETVASRIGGYLDLFRPHGDSECGALVHVARQHSRRHCLARAILHLQEAVQHRANAIARHSHHHCQSHQAMLEAIQQCVRDLKRLQERSDPMRSD